jgi:flavin reductase (DIM6/NTAB) family NADH-FMN oxidoreductase RutF
MAVTPDRFRDALRLWASGVTVLTTRRAGGIQGITVSSFASLSLEPPLVLACIARKAVSHDRIGAERVFAVNILADTQRDLADLAAGRSGAEGNRLPGIPWHAETTGAPVLDGCLAWVDCTLQEALPGGDHTIFVGRVEAAGQREGKPLLWFGSGYRTVGRRAP